MKKKLTLINYALAVIIISSLFLSCELFSPKVNSGSLVIVLEDESEVSRTLLPNISMEIYSYVISGVGPNGLSFEQSISQSRVFSKNQLLVGSWDIKVEGYNFDDVLVAEGVTTVIIEANEITESVISLEPLNGNGTLQIIINWEEALLSPGLQMVLYDINNQRVGTYLNEDFIYQDQRGGIEIENLSSGYYIAEIALYDGSDKIGKIFETIRIVKNEITNGEVSIKLGDTGNLDLTINKSLVDPLQIFVKSQNSENIFKLGEDVVYVANFSEDVDSFSWFLNGKFISNGARILNLGSQLLTGEYILSCIASTSKKFGSENVEFSVSDELYNEPSINSGYTFSNDFFGLLHKNYLLNENIETNYENDYAFFSQAYEIVDYSMLENYPNSLSTLFDELGLAVGESACVKYDENLFDDSNPNSESAMYFITRMDGAIPSDFYYIDSLENTTCVLSSHPYLEDDKYVKILTYYEDTADYGSYFEDIFNIDPNDYL